MEDIITLLKDKEKDRNKLMNSPEIDLTRAKREDMWKNDIQIYHNELIKKCLEDVDDSLPHKDVVELREYAFCLNREAEIRVLAHWAKKGYNILLSGRCNPKIVNSFRYYVPMFGSSNGTSSHSFSKCVEAWHWEPPLKRDVNTPDKVMYFIGEMADKNLYLPKGKIKDKLDSKTELEFMNFLQKLTTMKGSLIQGRRLGGIIDVVNEHLGVDPINLGNKNTTQKDSRNPLTLLRKLIF
tara:strand:+ start:841 stop:1557 length:717 start_codon:yes stop_codon:yes gene_type:complete